MYDAILTLIPSKDYIFVDFSRTWDRKWHITVELYSIEC